MSELWTSRTELLLGEANLQKLKNAHVLVVGLGGVGAYVAESLCRAGVGTLSLVDADVVNPSNINRQLVALNSTISRPKVDVLANRLKDINPHVNIYEHKVFIREDETIALLEAFKYDYIVDAIDTLSPKVYLLYHAMQKGFNIVSSMGAGGKKDPSQICISDISKTINCALARTVRKRLGRLGIKKGIKAVYTKEITQDEAIVPSDSEQNKKSIVGTVSYMPAIFGLFAASVVIRDLTEL